MWYTCNMENKEQPQESSVDARLQEPVNIVFNRRDIQAGAEEAQKLGGSALVDAFHKWLIDHKKELEDRGIAVPPTTS